MVLAVVVQRLAAYCNGFPCEGDALTRAAGARERATALPGVGLLCVQCRSQDTKSPRTFLVMFLNEVTTN